MDSMSVGMGVNDASDPDYRFVNWMHQLRRRPSEGFLCRFLIGNQVRSYGLICFIGRISPKGEKTSDS